MTRNKDPEDGQLEDSSIEDVMMLFLELKRFKQREEKQKQRKRQIEIQLEEVDNEIAACQMNQAKIKSTLAGHGAKTAEVAKAISDGSFDSKPKPVKRAGGKRRLSDEDKRNGLRECFDDYKSKFPNADEIPLKEIREYFEQHVTASKISNITIFFRRIIPDSMKVSGKKTRNSAVKIMEDF